MPGFVLLFKVGGLGGSQNWSNAFLPAAFQGTQFRHEGSPVLNLQPPAEFADTPRSTLEFAQALNRKHAADKLGWDGHDNNTDYHTATPLKPTSRSRLC